MLISYDHKSFKGHMLRADCMIPTGEMRLKKSPLEAQTNDGEREDEINTSILFYFSLFKDSFVFFKMHIFEIIILF